jgi:hypothetical protein
VSMMPTVGIRQLVASCRCRTVLWHSGGGCGSVPGWYCACPNYGGVEVGVSDVSPTLMATLLVGTLKKRIKSG